MRLAQWAPQCQFRNNCLLDNLCLCAEMKDYVPREMLLYAAWFRMEIEGFAWGATAWSMNGLRGIGSLRTLIEGETLETPYSAIAFILSRRPE